MHDMDPQLPNGEIDREGAMAKADLHKLANYALKLYKTIEDEDQLESWVQAKITKAADYIASVYHYLAYEMKFSHYGEKINDAEMYNESQKAEMLQRLAEAKAKLAALKELQAEKIISEGKDKTPIEKFNFEGISESKKIPTTWTDKSGKKHPATKVLGDKDSNKQEKEEDDKDDDKMDEVFDKNAKPGDTAKTTHGVATKTKTGLTHKRTFKDDPKDKKVDEELKGNQSKIDANKNGKIDADDFKKLRAGKKVKEAQADKDYDGDGEIESDKDEVWGSRAKAAAKAGKPFGKSKKESMELDEVSSDTHSKYQKAASKDIENREKSIDSSHAYQKKIGGDPMGDERASRDENKSKIEKREKGIAQSKHNQAKFQKETMEEKCEECGMYESKCECNKMDESAPSAGLSKGQKSSIAKKAKAGKDIGKPGKSFDKVAKAAGGGEKGKKIAAAAMWKNAPREESIELNEGTQLDQLKAMAADPRYANDAAAKEQLAKRIKIAQDRADLDKGEAVDASGKPIPVLDPKSFAAKNPNFKEDAVLAESIDLSRLKFLSGL